jgi:hypothetical protein
MALTPAVLERLEHARLLVHEQEGITLAHEALLSHWRRLQWWVADVREARERLEDLERDAARWSAMPDEIPLLPRLRVRNLDAVLRSGEHELSPHAVVYLRTSRAAANRARTLWGTAVGAAVALVALATFLYMTKLKSVIDDVVALGSRVNEVEDRIAKANDAIVRKDLLSAASELKAANAEAAEIHQGLDRAANAVGAQSPPRTQHPPTAIRPATPPATASTEIGLPPVPEVAVAPVASVAAPTSSTKPGVDPAPSPAPAAAPPAPAPALQFADEGELQSRFASISGFVGRACLGPAYARLHRPLSMTLEISVRPSGTVSSVKVVSFGAGTFDAYDDALGPCLERAVKSSFRYRETLPPEYEFKANLAYSGE